MSGRWAVLERLGWWSAFRTPGAVRVLSVSSLVDAFGTGLASTVLPFYLLQAAHVPPTTFALLLSTAGVAELAWAVPVGSLAGKIGIKKYTVLARLVSCVSYLVLATVSDHRLIFFAMVLAGLARSGSGGLLQALTAVLVPERERIGTIAVMRAIRNIGYLLAGALVAPVLALDSATLLRIAVAVNAASFLFSALLIARLKVPRQAVASPDRLDWSVLRDWRFLVLIAASATFAVSLRILDFSLPLWVLGHGITPVTVSAVALINTIMVVTCQYEFGRRVTDVPSAKKSLLRGVFWFGCMSVLLVASGWVGPVVGAAMVVGAGVFLTLGELTEQPAWWNLSYAAAPVQRRTEYLATFDVNLGLMNIAGPPALLAASHAGSWGWVAICGVLAVALAVTWMVVPNSQCEIETAAD